MTVTAGLIAHLIEPLPLIPPDRDRPSVQAEKNRIARAVAADLQRCGYTGPVFVGTYQWTARLRWHGVDARQIPGRSRPSQFTESENASGSRQSGLEFWKIGPPESDEKSGCLFGYEVLVRGQSGGRFGIIDRLGHSGMRFPRREVAHSAR